MHASSFPSSLLTPFLVSLPFLQIDVEPNSIYHRISEKAPVTTTTPIEGFFDGADAVAEALIPPFESVHAEGGYPG